MDYAELASWGRCSPSPGRDLDRGPAIYEGSDRLGAFDAVLGAAAEAAGADALVSADTAFAELKSVKHVVPDTTGVATLVANQSLKKLQQLGEAQKLREAT